MSRYRIVRDAVPGGTRRAFRLAGNVAQAVDRRMPEAKAMASWMDQDRAGLGLPDGEEFANAGLRAPLPATAWRRMQAAITRGLRTAPPEAGTSANLWLDTVGRRLAFDGLDRDILALLLLYALDDRVEHLADAVSTARGGPNCLRCDHPLLAMLLAASPGEVEARLHPDARLRASGLVHLDDNGDLNVSARLARLVRGSTTPGADPFAQLLGGGLAATLPWNAFAHLGREAEVAAAVLSATLAGRERGTNILLYGPPGTGKTTFAAALAQRVGATLRPVAEQDDAGGEPNRWERLNGCAWRNARRRRATPCCCSTRRRTCLSGPPSVTTAWSRPPACSCTACWSLRPSR